MGRREKLDSALVETFGKSPIVKTLDFLLTYPSFDYSKSQVAREIEISRVTMDKIWKKLIENEIIVKTRESGRGYLYKLNVENLKVKAIMRFDLDMTFSMLEKEGVSGRVKVPVTRR